MMILIVIAGSLIAIPQGIPVAGSDKTHHLLAYGVLMYWWGMLRPSRRLVWALSLVALGLVLEFLQSFTPHRFMEWTDALANALGVVLALGLLASPASGLLGWLDGKLGR